jgi:hypothetical protein
MEQIAVYGWAMVAILIVGVVLWQMGIFSGGSTSATFTGFGALKPVEWSCSAGDNTVTLTVLNGAGGQITNLSAIAGPDEGNCTPAMLAAGETTLCRVRLTSGSCFSAAAGSSYSQDVSIGYLSPSNQIRDSSGVVKGPADN